MNRVAVIGAGAWGTALAIQLQRAGCAVTLVARDPARARAMAQSRRNPRLPAIPIPIAVAVAAAPSAEADAVFLAPPLQHLRACLAGLAPSAAPLVICAKGIERGSLRLPLEIAREAHPGRAVAYLSGPNFAHEIAAGLPAAAVLAADEPGLRARLIGLIATPTFRVYGNDDPLGTQVGGAAKNVIAIAAGAVIGAGLGENARAGLVTRGLAELARIAVALGGRSETVMGLSGLGDLLLTCTGQASRNFSLGLRLGQGLPLAEAEALVEGVIEGVASAASLLARADGVDAPICRTVAALLAGETTLERAIARLLARPRRDE